MKNFKTVNGFVAGVLTTTIVLGSSLPVFASSTLQKIDVMMGGIDIYMDDKIQQPINANGDVVDAMIYDGTTYLPLRSVVNMLMPGTEIEWDGDTQSIYLGDHAKEMTSIPMDELTVYDETYSGFKTGEDATFKIMGESFTAFNMKGTSDYVYKLDSKYSTISGSFVIPFTDLKGTRAGEIGFYNVDKYGEETLIKSFSAKQGDAPIEFEVNVAGCQFVKIKENFVTIGDYSGSNGIIYDVTIQTAG